MFFFSWTIEGYFLVLGYTNINKTLSWHWLFQRDRGLGLKLATFSSVELTANHSACTRTSETFYHSSLPIFASFCQKILHFIRVHQRWTWKFRILTVTKTPTPLSLLVWTGQQLIEFLKLHFQGNNFEMGLFKSKAF